MIALSRAGVGVSVSETELTSPQAGVWKTIFGGSLFGNELSTTLPYLLGSHVSYDTSGQINPMLGTVDYPSNVDANTASANLVTAPPLVIPLVAANYSVAGLTTKLRILCGLASNATDHGAGTGAVHLYAVTGAGAADNQQLTLGSSAGSCSLGDWAASAETTHEGAEFSFPSDGLYTLGFAMSGANMAASSNVIVTALLQYQHE